LFVQVTADFSVPVMVGKPLESEDVVVSVVVVFLAGASVLVEVAGVAAVAVSVFSVVVAVVVFGVDEQATKLTIAIVTIINFIGTSLLGRLCYD
jgi:hypothetical protein